MTPVPLHHDVAGLDGAPVLLLGGSLGTSLAMWDPQIEALAQSLRVVRFDHRGHGRSPVPPGPYEIADLGRDVLALMDRIELGRASFCGLSIGGMVGMWLAAHASDRVDRLFLASISACLPPASAWAERAAAVRAARSTEVVADTVVERWLTPAFAAGRPDVVAELRAMLIATPPDGYAECCGAIERMDLRQDIPTIRAPTLVIMGADDPATPPVHGEAIAAAVPGARLALLEPGAHLVSVERPDEVAHLILDHCGGRHER